MDSMTLERYLKEEALLSEALASPVERPPAFFHEAGEKLGVPMETSTLTINDVLDVAIRLSFTYLEQIGKTSRPQTIPDERRSA